MRDLREYSDSNLMSEEAAQYIEGYIVDVLKEKNSFSFILTGGLFLQTLYRTLFYIDTLPWEKIHFFITDEIGPAEGEYESNFRSAVKNLLRRSNIPLQNIHWINTDIFPLEKCAGEYEKILKNYLERNGNSFDLVLLTLGPDGHIASLFPGFTALMEKERLVVSTEKALFDPRVPRITMTVPALNLCREVLFFVNDENCPDILDEILGRRKDDRFSYPAELVSGSRNRQIWFILRS